MKLETLNKKELIFLAKKLLKSHQQMGGVEGQDKPAGKPASRLLHWLKGKHQANKNPVSKERIETTLQSKVEDYESSPADRFISPSEIFQMWNLPTLQDFQIITGMPRSDSNLLENRISTFYNYYDDSNYNRRVMIQFILLNNLIFTYTKLNQFGVSYYAPAVLDLKKFKDTLHYVDQCFEIIKRVILNDKFVQSRTNDTINTMLRGINRTLDNTKKDSECFNNIILSLKIIIKALEQRYGITIFEKRQTTGWDELISRLPLVHSVWNYLTQLLFICVNLINVELDPRTPEPEITKLDFPFDSSMIKGMFDAIVIKPDDSSSFSKFTLANSKPLHWQKLIDMQSASSVKPGEVISTDGIEDAFHDKPRDSH